MRLKTRSKGDDSRDPEAKMLLHGRKVAVVVEQRMAMFDAKGADDNAGGLADCDAQFSQLAIIASGTRSQIGAQERHKGKLAQSLTEKERRVCGLVSRARRSA
jgi:hypothetical protein